MKEKTSKDKTTKAAVKVKDLKPKTNPKGGAFMVEAEKHVKGAHGPQHAR